MKANRKSTDVELKFLSIYGTPKEKRKSLIELERRKQFVIRKCLKLKQPKLKGGIKMAKKEVSKAKVTIASLVYDLIKKGKKDEAIIAEIKKKFPESKINESHMNWYRRQLKIQDGEVAIPTVKAKKNDVKKPSKEDAEDEEADEDEVEEDDEDDEEEEDEEVDKE